MLPSLLLYAALFQPLQAQARAPFDVPQTPAAQELVDLQRRLESWAALPDWPFVGQPDDAHPLGQAVRGNPCPELSIRLATFEQRFGCVATDQPEWTGLATAARALLGRLGEFSRPPYGQHEHGHRWIMPGWIGIRALLHELAGDSDEARELLFGDRPRCWKQCCGFCLPMDLYALCRQRAESLDRCHESEAAARWYLAAVWWGTVDSQGAAYGRVKPDSGPVAGRLLTLLEQQGDLVAADAVRRFALRAEDDAREFGVPVRWLPEGVSRERIPADGPMLRVVGLGVGESFDPWQAETSALRAQVSAYLIVDEGQKTWRVLACRVPHVPGADVGRRYQPRCQADFELLAPDDLQLRDLLGPAAGEAGAR